MTADIIPPLPHAALQRVAMLMKPEMHPFMLELAGLLKAEHGSTLFYHFGPQGGFKAFAASPARALFDDIDSGYPRYEACFAEGLDAERVIARARAHEDLLGMPINWLLQKDRHFGRGYSPGGINHPESHMSRNTTYLQVLHAISETTDFWIAYLDRVRPTLMINGDHILEALCKQRGIPFRLVAGSRYKNLCYWGDDSFFDTPLIQARYRANLATPTAAPAIEGSYRAHVVTRKAVNHDTKLHRLALQIGRLVARQVYWKLRGNPKARSYFLRDNIAMLWRRRADFRYLASPQRGQLADLTDRDFIFYPLQTEPEASLTSLSPEYTHQLEAIATIARDLPAGVLLAVKDTHLAIGRRPADFYRQITAFKNVVLLDINIPGPEVVRAAKAVVTISGTPGYEGAIMGKPVISLGRHNHYAFLDHVWQVTDTNDLRAALTWALTWALTGEQAGEQAGDIDTERAEREGQAFLQALIDISFDMYGYDYNTRTNLDPRSAPEALTRLIEGLC